MDANRDFDDAARLSHLLWEVSARVSTVTDIALADSPLTPASSGLLDAVGANPGTSIAALARWLPTSQQGISQIVGRLERLGYLTRTLGPRDPAVPAFIDIGLHIPPEGESARRDANQRLQDADRHLAQLIGQQPHDDLVDLLRHARGILENAAADSSAVPMR